jgi:hypothetical protein
MSSTNTISLVFISYLPRQSTPSPENPGLHAQAKLPNVFMQFAFAWQLLSSGSLHSFMSGNEKNITDLRSTSILVYIMIGVS